MFVIRLDAGKPDWEKPEEWQLVSFRMQKNFFCQHQFSALYVSRYPTGRLPLFGIVYPRLGWPFSFNGFRHDPKPSFVFLGFEKNYAIISVGRFYLSLYISPFTNFLLLSFICIFLSTLLVLFHSIHLFFFIFTFCYYYTHHPRLNPSSTSPIQSVREHRYSFAVDFDQFLLTVKLSILYSAYCLLFFIYRV